MINVIWSDVGGNNAAKDLCNVDSICEVIEGCFNNTKLDIDQKLKIREAVEKVFNSDAEFDKAIIYNGNVILGEENDVPIFDVGKMVQFIKLHGKEARGDPNPLFSKFIIVKG